MTDFDKIRNYYRYFNHPDQVNAQSLKKKTGKCMR